MTTCLAKTALTHLLHAKQSASITFNHHQRMQALSKLTSLRLDCLGCLAHLLSLCSVPSCCAHGRLGCSSTCAPLRCLSCCALEAEGAYSVLLLRWLPDLLWCVCGRAVQGICSYDAPSGSPDNQGRGDLLWGRRQNWLRLLQLCRRALKSCVTLLGGLYAWQRLSVGWLRSSLFCKDLSPGICSSLIL